MATAGIQFKIMPKSLEVNLETLKEQIESLEEGYKLLSKEYIGTNN